MRRTFNYTGRKTIPQGCVSIHLQRPKDGGSPTFAAHFTDLDGLGIPRDAAIYVEPYVGGSSTMRFAFGTVGAPSTPANVTLDELDAGGRILFRIKVVDESGTVGRLLASSLEIAAREEADEQGRKPLLPLRHADLEQELWKLSVREEEGPELLVNNRVPGLADRIKSDPTIQGLVLPNLLRSVVRHLFNDDLPEWAADWRIVATKAHGESIDWELNTEDDGDEIEQIVERVVRKFVADQRYAAKAAEQAGGSDG